MHLVPFSMGAPVPIALVNMRFRAMVVEVGDSVCLSIASVPSLPVLLLDFA